MGRHHTPAGPQPVVPLPAEGRHRHARPAPGAALAAEATALAARWRARAERGGETWPAEAAATVTLAVLGALRHGDEETLHGAGRRWGEAQHHSGSLTAGVAVLGNILVEEHHDPVVVERVLDGVLAGAALSLSRRLEIEARVDELTGAGNRRAFDEALAGLLADSTRHRFPLALVLVDIDGMKYINDGAGHQAGDEALVRFVAAAQSELRQGDRIFRIGGDEFAVVMPYCDSLHAARSMGRVDQGAGPAFSWGVACYPDDGATAAALLAGADGAMYRHKAQRRSPPAADAR